MKKLLLTLIIFIILLTPINIKAEEFDDKYPSLNLKEVLKEEDIDPSFTNFDENDSNKITIYLFRGKGCAFCRAFITYLNSIVKDYGKYFKLKSFEVWYNSNNSTLLSKTSTFMGEKASGIPYILIGDKVFTGYTSEYDEDIKTAIKDLYESKDRYDVFTEMKDIDSLPTEPESENTSTDEERNYANTEASYSQKTSTTTSKLSIFNTCIIIGLVIIIIFNIVRINTLNTKVNDLTEELKKLKK